MFVRVRNPLPTMPRRIAVDLTAVAERLRPSPCPRLRRWAGAHARYASPDVLPIFHRHARSFLKVFHYQTKRHAALHSNGITERGTPKTGVPLFVITPMYVFAPNNYIGSVSVKVAQTILYPREWLSRILFVLLP